MKLRLAQPSDAEQIAQFYREIHDRSFPHREIFEAQVVDDRLYDRDLAIVMALDGEELLGCGLAFPKQWNQTMEIGTLSVRPNPRRGQIGKALFEALRRYGLKEFGVVFFRASNEAAFRRAREIGAICWGFWPEPRARSRGEAELLMGFFNPDHSYRRVEPPSTAITESEFARRIVRSLPNAEHGVNYPKNFPVGQPQGTGTPVISGNVWPSYQKREKILTIENSAGPYPMEILREFVGKVRKKGISDIRMNMPVNQDEAYRSLRDFGFTPVAYLPGWYLRGNYRFDCVQLIAGISRPSRGSSDFMERAVSKVIAGF